MTDLSRDLFRRTLPALVALTLGASAPLAAVEVEARLVIPPGAETVIDSAASLPVLALAEVNLPVRKTAVLAKLDKEQLEKELDAARRDLAAAQNEKRRRQTDQPVVRGGSGGGGVTGPTSSREFELANDETQAMSEISDLQSRIAQAAIRAPEDGYIVKHLFAVGAKAKKRKPFMTFAEASKTVIEASVPAAEATGFTPGATVRLSATTGEAKSLQGKVLSATPQGESVALRIQPLELAFFPLATPTRLALSVAP